MATELMSNASSYVNLYRIESNHGFARYIVGESMEDVFKKLKSQVSIEENVSIIMECRYVDLTEAALRHFIFDNYGEKDGLENK